MDHIPEGMDKSCWFKITASTDTCRGIASQLRWLSMNVDHFGIFVSLIVLAVFLSIALLAQANISVLPEITFTQNSNSGFDEYCKNLNLKC